MDAALSAALQVVSMKLQPAAARALPPATPTTTTSCMEGPAYCTYVPHGKQAPIKEQ
jgi:hypothetical protein